MNQHITIDDLKPGAIIEWLRGHHPGARNKVIRVTATTVILETAKGVKRQGSVRPGGQVTIGLEHVLSNAMLVKRAPERMEPAIAEAMRLAVERLGVRDDPDAAIGPDVAGSSFTRINGQADGVVLDVAHLEEPESASTRVYYRVLDIQDACLARGINANVLNEALLAWGKQGVAERLGLSRAQVGNLQTSWGITLTNAIPSGAAGWASVSLFDRPLVVTRRAVQKLHEGPLPVVYHKEEHVIAEPPVVATLRQAAVSDVIASHVERMKNDRSEFTRQIAEKDREMQALEVQVDALDKAIAALQALDA